MPDLEALNASLSHVRVSYDVMHRRWYVDAAGRRLDALDVPWEVEEKARQHDAAEAKRQNQTTLF